MSDPIAYVVWFYRQRAGAENLNKEANGDAGLAAHPSERFDTNRIHLQMAMFAYNFNCWLLLHNREPEADSMKLKHTTLSLARFCFLFIAVKLCNHAALVGIH